MASPGNKNARHLSVLPSYAYLQHPDSTSLQHSEYWENTQQVEGSG